MLAHCLSRTEVEQGVRAIDCQSWSQKEDSGLLDSLGATLRM